MSQWRLIDSGPAAGPWNLALDEAIFHAVRTGRTPPTLRLYRWSAPTLTIGYAQDLERDVDSAACRALGIAVIRRITGGRAVLHDAEVTYSVSAPEGLPGFAAGLGEACRLIATGLLAGLRLLGLEGARPATGPERAQRSPRHPGCFATVGRHEIEIAGRKLIGSAQRRARGAFLQQGSILLESHGTLLARVLCGPPVLERRAEMAGLSDVLRPCPAPAAVVAAVAAGCAAAWGVEFLAGAPSVAETLEARELEALRYRSEDWNAARRPGIPLAGDRFPP